MAEYMKTITRAKYLDRIIELNGTPDIKIITGIRRSGKSKLMQAYIAYLKSNFENINIISVSYTHLDVYKRQVDMVMPSVGKLSPYLSRRIWIAFIKLS